MTKTTPDCDIPNCKSLYFKSSLLLKPTKMSSISETVCQSLDARIVADNVCFQGIRLRNKISRDLSSLLSYMDTLSWKACQEGGQVGPILDIVHSKADEIKDNLEYSDLNPTPEHFSWL